MNSPITSLTAAPDALQLALQRPAVAGPDDVRRIEAELADPLAGIDSTYALLGRGAARGGEKPALSFFLQAAQFQQPFAWSHREWFARITQTANLLRSLGLGREDVVAFVLPNLPETHWAIWGGEAAGIVFAVNPMLESSMVLELMKAVRPKLLVTLAPTPGTDLWQKIEGIAGQIPGLQAILTVSLAPYLPHVAGADSGALASLKPRPILAGGVPVLDFHAELSKAPAAKLAFEPPALGDIASYFCTGGTTGTPKIAVRTHRTEVANAVQLAAMFGNLAGEDQPLFCGLPLFHVNAQIGTGLMPWSVGGHVVLGTPQGYRAPDLIPQFWRIAAHYRLLSFSGVPTVYSALLQAPRGNVDLSSLRFGLCGAAPMPLELIQRFQRETGIKILEGYGLTEGGCVSTLNPPEGPAKPGAIGIRLPWQNMKVVVLDAEGGYLREADTDEVGTIVISGPNLFAGYLNPAHNMRLWIDVPPAAGTAPLRWLHTGDLGRVDGEGYFWLTGRSKELIIRGGHNIDPKLIEEPMHQHPAVALAAAIGRPDAHAGEVPSVYVQLRPGAEATPQDLLEWAQSHIAERAAWPKQVRILDALPTTAVGKIFKPALTEMEVASVVADEARDAGVTLKSCEVIRDPQRGLLVRWAAEGDGAALAQRLGRFTFQTEQL